MKKILMLFIAVSLAYSCKSTKASNSGVAANETAIEKKLQQTWILDNLNGKKVTEKDFSKLPEIQMASSSFSGSTGCNAVKGTLVSSGAGKLQFPTVTSETKKCDAKKEGEFLQLLRTTSGYSVENNILYLSNQFGLTMSFKKK
ncbi:META domain-containing protein [Flavobacterium hungaricum]|uniref:META domain-containing protein n=1 Tax=Flavobacterium hungaricum TaxID=2082725 RepID=A0ABR9TP82_9FLAO|nr:META domain-containing protein [Flavobacterium hungaricum]MBE8726624.1 META domain-containing protein [Flavobacterium hungaricum]